MKNFEQFTKDGREKPYTLSRHKYKGYTAERFYSTRPFKVYAPDGTALYFRKDNTKGYNRISFSEICHRIDNGTLGEFYGNPNTEAFFYNA